MESLPFACSLVRKESTDHGLVGRVVSLLQDPCQLLRSDEGRGALFEKHEEGAGPLSMMSGLAISIITGDQDARPLKPGEFALHERFESTRDPVENPPAQAPQRTSITRLSCTGRRLSRFRAHDRVYVLNELSAVSELSRHFLPLPLKDATVQRILDFPLPQRP